jgi:hypothetical protein
MGFLLKTAMPDDPDPQWTAEITLGSWVSSFLSYFLAEP